MLTVPKSCLLAYFLFDSLATNAVDGPPCKILTTLIFEAQTKLFACNALDHRHGDSDSWVVIEKVVHDPSNRNAIADVMEICDNILDDLRKNC